MAMNLNLENYISGLAFKYGMDLAFGKIPVSESVPKEMFVFLILFNSENENDKKVIISTKNLKLENPDEIGDMILDANDNNGAKLIIKEISNTKNYLDDTTQRTSKVDGFAFIRCAADETIPSNAAGDKFPDLKDEAAKVILKGKLVNNPTFTFTSKVTISSFNVNFGVAI